MARAMIREAMSDPIGSTVKTKIRSYGRASEGGVSNRISILSVSAGLLGVLLSACSNQPEPSAAAEVTIGQAQATLKTTADCPRGSNVILGTDGSDHLVGTSGRDCILGLDGDDVIDGLGGDDTIFGGSGNDTLSGGRGSDSIYGEDGNDVLIGDGSADKLLSGGAGNDLIAAGKGRNGDRVIDCGSGVDASSRAASGCEQVAPECDRRGQCSSGLHCQAATSLCVTCLASSDCYDGNACTADTCVGYTACELPPVNVCSSGDSCCPTGCDSLNDADCSPSCGNGVVESGESCDPAASCPTDCSDGNACTVDQMTGSAANCNVACTHTNIVSCSKAADGCCPSGCNSVDDADCSPRCGNNVVEPGETCDPMSSCPTSCSDGNSCTLDQMTGSAANCNVACAHTNIVTCAVAADGCCPAGCNAANDPDCSPMCDNGVVEPGETCDPPSSCLTNCSDGNACTIDQMTGNAANCNVACSYQSITTCASGDGCCPAGCNSNTDSDCSPLCGNGAIERGETCDPLENCPTSCSDGNACTIDQMTGSVANCNVTCSHTVISTCISGDGCCPGGCNSIADSDCSPLCGNWMVEKGETCDPSASCPNNCNDGNACTIDQTTGSAANCNVACSHTSISACAAGDGCCPAGCNANTDADCSPLCGNEVLEPGETCDPPASCASSCSDGNACTIDQMTGSATNCNVACSYLPIVTCGSGDGCCPTGCDANTDAECSPSCDNGVVERGESCDPVASCPTNCSDGDACTIDQLTGSAANCNSVCSHTVIAACVPTADGCCPAGCNATNDPDCSPLCGNDVKESGETCDPISTCLVSCNDGNACTVDQMTGSAANCNVACSFTPITSCTTSADGCCPAGCNANSDPDCSPTCGNWAIESGESCDPPEACPTSCNDADACTIDQITGSAANCSAICSHSLITACALTADDCCPAGCTAETDSDCPPSIAPFVANELLGRPTDHSVTVNAIAGEAAEAYFEYGTASGVYSGSSSRVDYPDGNITVVIDGLSPDTRYYYRMRYRRSGSTTTFIAGSEHTFHTQRAPGSVFTFAVQSDSHQGYAAFYNDALYRVTMGNILDAQPDFLLDLGDFVSTDDSSETETSVRQKYLNQRSVVELASHSTPIFLVLGNHENEEGWNLDDFGANRQNSLPVLGANGRKRYFLNPVPDNFYSGNTDPLPELDGDHLRGDYYAFEWGNALFVAIDPYWYTMTKPFTGAMGGEKTDDVGSGERWDWTLGNQQYAWLKQTLESSTAKFKFVFAHHTTGGTDDYVRAGALGAKYCEWGGYNEDGTTWAFESRRPGWEMPIHQLLVHTGVTAFIHGHDHVFAYENLDGIVYLSLPHAANHDYGAGFSTNVQDYADGAMVNNSGYIRITVGPTTATADYLRSYLPGDGTNKTVAYSSVILPCDARDSDGDGTDDCSDGCPSNAGKLAPGACGCGSPDTDSDGDGTADCRDRCPNDPLKVAPGTCDCGHPDIPDCCAAGPGQCGPVRFKVVRVGTGSGALSTTATAVFVEERNLSDGALVNTIALPTAAAGGNAQFTLVGSAYKEGTLKQSADGHYLTLAGYDAAPGAANPAQVAASSVNRVVARIAADGSVDTTTRLSNAFNGAANVNINPRAAVTNDGSGFWVSGAGTTSNLSGGMWYVPYGATAGTQLVGLTSSSPFTQWSCGIYNGQLYATSSTVGSYVGVFSVGVGLPIDVASAAVTMLPGIPTATGPSPVDFALLDRDSAVAGMDTLYLSDDRATASGGGIQKWTFNGTTWSLAYTLNAGMTSGIRHLLAVESPSGVTLFGGTSPSSGTNAIVKIVDNGSSSSATTLVTAATNTAFRGLALPPVP